MTLSTVDDEEECREGERMVGRGKDGKWYELRANQIATNFQSDTCLIREFRYKADRLRLLMSSFQPPFRLGSSLFSVDPVTLGRFVELRGCVRLCPLFYPTIPSTTNVRL
jgi:hypothetical protein